MSAEPASPESPSPPVVVHLREGFDVYIGRAFRWQGKWLPASQFANPHRIQPGTSREQAIERYRQDARKKLTEEPSFARAIRALEAQRLGCFCKPEACHGDVLVELFHELTKTTPAQNPQVKPRTSPDQGSLFD